MEWDEIVMEKWAESDPDYHDDLTLQVQDDQRVHHFKTCYALLARQSPLFKDWFTMETAHCCPTQFDRFDDIGILEDSGDTVLQESVEDVEALLKAIYVLKLVIFFSGLPEYLSVVEVEDLSAKISHSTRYLAFLDCPINTKWPTFSQELNPC
jgi:hypothetical protein